MEDESREVWLSISVCYRHPGPQCARNRNTQLQGGYVPASFQKLSRMMFRDITEEDAWLPFFRDSWTLILL